MFKSIVLRTKSSYTVFSLLNLAVVVLLLIALSMLVESMLLRVGLLGLTYLLAAVVIDRTVLRLWRNKIVLDEQGMSASIDRSYLRVRWDEIEAVWQPEAVAKIGILRMTTSSGTEQLYLNLFDKPRTWQAIRARIPPAALQAGSYKQEPTYQEFQSVLRELIANYDLPLVTKHGPAQAAAWLAAGLFLPLAAACIDARLWLFVPFYLVFGIAGVIYLLAIGRTEIDLLGITHHAWLGRFHVTWDEITLLESSPLDTWMVLHAGDRRLSMPGLRLWSGVDRGRLLSLYMYLLAEKEIVQSEGHWVDFKLRNRGTRLARHTRADPPAPGGDQAA